MSKHVDITTLNEDEIDLREVWQTLVKRKLTIIIITLITTISAVIYAMSVTPLYRGEILLEVGDIIINAAGTNDKPTMIRKIENPNDLKEVILQTMNINNENSPRIEVSIPKGSNNLIQINYEDTDSKAITKKLQVATAFVLKRHNDKIAAFQKSDAQICPSKLVGNITVTPDPIKPKKGFIIAAALITGLMLGVFLAFFREFISNGRTADETPEMHKK